MTSRLADPGECAQWGTRIANLVNGVRLWVYEACEWQSRGIFVRPNGPRLHLLVLDVNASDKALDWENDPSGHRSPSETWTNRLISEGE